VCAVLSRTVSVCRVSLRVGRCATPITSSWKEGKKEVSALVSALDLFPHHGAPTTWWVSPMGYLVNTPHGGRGSHQKIR
jgi:hypothetical protein